MKPEGPPEWATPVSLARELRLSLATVRRLLRRGEVPGAVRIGSLWRIHRATMIAEWTRPGPLRRSAVRGPSRRAPAAGTLRRIASSLDA